jgi:hypothetical protein
MTKKTIAILIYSFGSATLLAGGPVSAQVTQQPHASVICGGSANKTLTFDYKSPRQEATSGTAYANGDCTSFVVDVVVPSAGGKSESAILIGSGAGGKLTKANCESYSETYSIRKVGADGKFSVVASGTHHGKWNSTNTPVTDPHCMIQGGDAYSFKRPATGSEKYRVLTKATLNGKVTPVEVSVAFRPDPPK